MRKFTIEKDYYGTGCEIFKKKSVAINPGVTVLVGCNGIGKSTLIKQLQAALKQKKIPVTSYDNLRDGGNHAHKEAGFRHDYAKLAGLMQSSEGESITMNISDFASRVGYFCREHANAPELWILFDAVDSGLSVDNIVELKSFFELVMDTTPNSDVYIVITANEYEMARGENCFDVYQGKYVRFESYEEYREFILKTREQKDNRENDGEDKS